MSGYMAAQAQDDVRAMIAQVKTLTVEKLKNLLRFESLTLSGVKSELQIRIIARTFHCATVISLRPLATVLPDICWNRYREDAQRCRC